MQIKIMKRLRFISVLMIIFFVFVLAGCEDGVELGENEVKVKNSESTFVGTNYEEVVEKLQEWGFTNIETEAVYDIFWGITKEGTTKSVTIDGSSGFKSGDVVNKDVAIVVTYSMKESNDPAKKTYDIVWKDYDGTTLKTDKLTLGATPIYTGKEPTRESNGAVKYLFNGWSPEIEVVAESKTYTAMYTEVENILTITFNLDGGNWDLENSQSVAYNGKITNVTPIKEGFDFNGWVIKGFWSDTKFDSSTAIQTDYTLTAAWTTKKYTVVFDLDGGAWSRENEQIVEHNKTITTSKPTKTGHEFIGWLLDGEDFNSSDPVKTNLSLKAKWNQQQQLNFEDILVGRWDGSLGLNQGHLMFIEFSGVFYDSNGERKSSLIDIDHDVIPFTLNGNKMGINYSDVGMVYYTITYNNGRLTLSAPGYYNYTLSKIK